MPIKFSEHFQINEDAINQFDIFDIILDVDTRFFIDPALLPLCNVPEFIHARQKVQDYFSDIIRLLKYSNNPDDLCWKRADSLLTFHELTGTCLGYSRIGTSGNSIGLILRQQILKTMKEILCLGKMDPLLFELLGVFQDKLGCDRISDLVTYILRREIYQFTDRVCQELNIDNLNVTLDGHVYRTCLNPCNQKPLLLLPKSILSPLPTAELFYNVNEICRENCRVRNEINSYIDFKHRYILEKEEILSLLKHSYLFQETLINGYLRYPVEAYNFSEDPCGEYIWYDAAKKYAKLFPLDFSSYPTNDIKDVLSVVRELCVHFKGLIEDNGLSSLLFDSNGSAKKESASQLLFFGISSFCCNINNIDITREANNGHGPVDFKLSRGSQDKVLVEVKLTSNSRLRHGIETQLPVYMKQENVKKAIYLIIDTGHRKTLENFEDYYQTLDKELKEKIEYFVIDATPKKSASKA